MSEMHRARALRIKKDMANNWRIIQRIRIALQLALIVLLLEILTWLVSIAVAAGASRCSPKARNPKRCTPLRRVPSIRCPLCSDDGA